MRARGFKRFLADRRGATAVEYGLIVSILIVGLLASLHRFKNANDQVFNTVESAMENAHTP